MSCILRIIGEELDVDLLDAKLGLPTPKKIYKGQPRFKTKPEGEKIAHSELSFTASHAPFDNFNQQVEEVIEYLSKYYYQLKLLTETKGIEYATLDFGVNYRYKFVQSHYFKPELVKLAGELGLSFEFSLYTSSGE